MNITAVIKTQRLRCLERVLRMEDKINVNRIFGTSRMLTQPRMHPRSSR